MKLEETTTYKLYHHLDHNITKYSKEGILFEDFIQALYDLFASSESWNQFAENASKYLQMYFENILDISRFLEDLKKFLAASGQSELFGDMELEECETESQKSEGTERSQVTSNISNSDNLENKKEDTVQQESIDEKTQTAYDYFAEEIDSDEEIMIEKNYRRNRESEPKKQVIEHSRLANSIQGKPQTIESQITHNVRDKILVQNKDNILLPNHQKCLKYSFPLEYYPYLSQRQQLMEGKSPSEMNNINQIRADFFLTQNKALPTRMSNPKHSQKVSISDLQNTVLDNQTNDSVNEKKVKFLFVSPNEQRGVATQDENQTKPKEKARKNKMQFSKASNLVYAKNIPLECNSVSTLKNLFSKFGPVVDIKLDSCRRLATIQFLKEADAIKASHNYANLMSNTQMIVTRKPQTFNTKTNSDERIINKDKITLLLRSNESMTEKLKFLYSLKKFLVDKDKKEILTQRIKEIKEAQKTNLVTESAQQILDAEPFNLDSDMTLVLSDWNGQKPFTAKILNSILQKHGSIETLKLNPILKSAEVKYYNIESAIQALQSNDGFSINFRDPELEQLFLKIKLFEGKYLTNEASRRQSSVA